MKLFGALDYKLNEEKFSDFVCRLLSNQLQKRIVLKTDRFSEEMGVWVYIVYYEHCNELVELTGSDQWLAYIREYVHSCYERGLVNDDPIIDPLMFNGGFDKFEAEDYPFYTISLLNLVDNPSEESKIKVIYWSLRCWADAVYVIDPSCPVPKIFSDMTMTIALTDPTYIVVICNSIIENVRNRMFVPLQIVNIGLPPDNYLDDNSYLQRAIEFRTLPGYPLIIGQYGVRENIPITQSLNPLDYYRDWLYPCFKETVSITWREMGRLIYSDKGCYSVEDSSINDPIITFMNKNRVFSIWGIYPLGPFDGILPFPPQVANSKIYELLEDLPNSINNMLLSY